MIFTNKVHTELKRSDLLRLQAEFIDKLNNGLIKTNHKYLKVRFLGKFTTIKHFNDVEHQFDSEYLFIDKNGCMLYGTHHGYHHKVYMRPDDIKEII